MKTALSTLLLATFLSSCSWFDSLKPKETFYCKVNGDKFRPDKDTSPIGGIGSNPLRVSFDKEKGWLYIDVRNTPKLISIALKLDYNEYPMIKDYQLSKNTSNSNAIYYPDYAALPTIREQLFSDSGVFRITKIDGYNLSGTFEFTCKSAKTGIEYKITDGEFNDISYY